MNAVFTPLHIMIGCHYHYSLVDYGETLNNFSAPAVQEYIGHFIEAGLLVRTSRAYPNSFKATEGLKTWIEALCNTPFPTQIWLIPSHKYEYEMVVEK